MTRRRVGFRNARYYHTVESETGASMALGANSSRPGAQTGDRPIDRLLDPFRPGINERAGRDRIRQRLEADERGMAIEPGNGKPHHFRRAVRDDGARLIRLLAHSVERHRVQRSFDRHREASLRCRTAIEKVAAPIDDIGRPFGEAPVGGVFGGLEGVGRLQRPERQIFAAGARRDPEALAGAEVRLRQHLLDLRAAVPGIPRLLLRGLGEVAPNDVDEGHAGFQATRGVTNRRPSGGSAHMASGRPHSGLIPTCFTTAPQRADSLRMNAPKSSDVPPWTSAPCSVRLLRISGISRTFTSSALSRCTIAGGVPPGAATPYHSAMSIPG